MIISSRKPLGRKNDSIGFGQDFSKFGVTK